jgi:hypothetical protein
MERDGKGRERMEGEGGGAGWFGKGKGGKKGGEVGGGEEEVRRRWEEARRRGGGVILYNNTQVTGNFPPANTRTDDKTFPPLQKKPNPKTIETNRLKKKKKKRKGKIKPTMPIKAREIRFFHMRDDVE